MRCLSCNHDNRSDAKFCNECASPLKSGCATCGTENPPAAKFCNQCASPLGTPQTTARAAQADPRSYTPERLAEKIRQSKDALEGERKQVTVLFADVLGSMEPAEQLDPEARSCSGSSASWPRAWRRSRRPHVAV